MPSHTFTTDAPVIRQELTPPAGATAVIIHFTVSAPAVSPGNVRLAHLRTLHSVLHPNLPAENRLPRESEICELKVRNGELIAEFSGKGGKNAQNKVQRMGGAPASFPVTITMPFSGQGAIVAAGSLVATSNTDIAPNGQTVELVLGMPLVQGADLQPPYGYTFAWDESAVEWAGAPAQHPATTPAIPAPPPTTPVNPTTPPPIVPLPVVPGKDPRLAAALELARAFGIINPSPEQIAAIQLFLTLRGDH